MRGRWIQIPAPLGNRLRQALRLPHVRRCPRCKELLYRGLLSQGPADASRSLEAVEEHRRLPPAGPACGLRRCVFHEKIDLLAAHRMMRIAGVAFHPRWWWDVVIPLEPAPGEDPPGHDSSVDLIPPASLVLWFRKDHAMAHVEPYIARIDDPCPEEDPVAWTAALLDRFLGDYGLWAFCAYDDLKGLAFLDLEVTPAH